MKFASVVIVAFILAGCGQPPGDAPVAHRSPAPTANTPGPSPTGTASPSALATSSPSTSPSAGPSAATEGVLMLTGQGQLGGTTTTKYVLYVISGAGRILRSATAGIQSAGWFLPRFSVAGTSVYFLDGDRDLKVLRNDGSVADIGQVPGGSADRIIFAVSPDEQQIAYTVLHYASGGTTSTSLRVGPLATLQVHEIFAGSPIEYPIGWSAGRLVVVVTAYSFIQNNGEVNPYFADAYHIVDPATGNRLHGTPSAGGPQGPVNSAGTVWAQTSGFQAIAWNGTVRPLGNLDNVPPAVLNPDGARAAVATGSSKQIDILSGGNPSPTAANGTPAGWFDEDHILFITGSCCNGTTTASILTVSTNALTPVSAGMTGQADDYAPFFVSIPNSLH